MNGPAPKPKTPPYLHRPLKSRTFSPSSPIRTPLIDNEIVLMNTLYKERFPKATQQVKRLDFYPHIISIMVLVSISPRSRWRRDCETLSATTSTLRSWLQRRGKRGEVCCPKIVLLLSDSCTIRYKSFTSYLTFQI